MGNFLFYKFLWRCCWCFLLFGVWLVTHRQDELWENARRRTNTDTEESAAAPLTGATPDMEALQTKTKYDSPFVCPTIQPADHTSRSSANYQYSRRNHRHRPAWVGHREGWLYSTIIIYLCQSESGLWL